MCFPLEKLVLSGILPNLVKNILGVCCPKSNVTYGELYKSVEQLETYYGTQNNMDFTFPLYGLDGMQTTKFKDNPFIPLVEAPRIVLLVPDALFVSKNTRTTVLMNTIFNAWPMLIFIFVSASLSGLTIWMCVSLIILFYSISLLIILYNWDGQETLSLR